MALNCQCPYFSGCSSPATQEDLLCDACRAFSTDWENNIHTGPVDKAGPHWTGKGGFAPQGREEAHP